MVVVSVNLGENIKKARKARKLTQKQLADKLGVAEITVRKYEADKREPSFDTLQRIADALDISVGTLLDVDGILKHADDEVAKTEKMIADMDRQTQAEINDILNEDEPPRKPHVTEIRVESDGTISPLGRFFDDRDRYEELEALLKSEADESQIEAYKKEMQEINLRILSYAPEVQAQMQVVVDVIGKMFKDFDWKTIAQTQQDNFKKITDQFSGLMEPASKTALIGFQNLADSIKEMNLDALAAADDEAAADDPEGDEP